MKIWNNWQVIVSRLERRLEEYWEIVERMLANYKWMSTWRQGNAINETGLNTLLCSVQNSVVAAEKEYPISIHLDVDRRERNGSSSLFLSLFVRRLARQTVGLMKQVAASSQKFPHVDCTVEICGGGEKFLQNKSGE